MDIFDEECSPTFILVELITLLLQKLMFSCAINVHFMIGRGLLFTETVMKRESFSDISMLAGKCVAADDQNLRLVIHSDEKFRIISECHINSGSHLGVNKTVVKIQERYYWKEAFPLYTKNASEIAENLYTLFCRHGVPLEMISDNGGEFNSKLSGVIYDMYGYKHIKITPYNPQANGKCERYNQTLKNMLNKTVKEETNLWERFLPKCLFSYNTSKHSSTNFSPFYLMYWRNPILANEQSIEVDFGESHGKCRSSTKKKLHFDNRHNIHENEFKENDNVLVKNKKRKKGMEKQNWLGPYKIDKVVKKGTYRIKCVSSDDVIGTFKQMNIKKYYSPNDNTQTVSAEIHFEPNKTQPVVDHHDLDESYESNNNENQDQNSDMNNNNCDVLDGSLFLTQSTFKEIDTEDEIEIIEQYIQEQNDKEDETQNKRPKESVEIRNVNLVF
ncbi:unnamed protein product [Mytilus coruscus]|uniref:Integrase catalytic domain-containing protein n=1 Tax=Mytilus coruscus TaxID=42192 RepID=A0A6J8BN80_MYTCO|nr:unnamed protein product [Mytilus coruscus]